MILNPQATGDSTGLTSIGVQCKKDSKYTYQGTNAAGTITSVKAVCPTNLVLCGLRTRVMNDHGEAKDNMGLVDIAFKCCSINVKG